MASAISITFAANQHANPVLKHLAGGGGGGARSTISLVRSPRPTDVFDFEISPTTAVLFLSLRYHNLHPDYIYSRIEPLKRTAYRFLGLVILVDDSNCEQALLRTQALAFNNRMTVLVAFSELEAARYLENLKLSQHRPSDDIEGKRAGDYVGKCTEALGKVKGVNKSDSKTLLRNFKSMRSILLASPEQLALCHGLAEKKVTRMHDVFNKPFFTAATAAAATTTTTTTTTRDDEDEEEDDEVEILEQV